MWLVIYGLLQLYFVYDLNLSGLCYVFQIYCAEMQTDFPKEYVTLRSGLTDNYSEVYGYRCGIILTKKP